MHLHDHFFFNDTATTEIYTLSLHDALPISRRSASATRARTCPRVCRRPVSSSTTTRPRAAPGTWSGEAPWMPDRKSTRLNSSHANISYAVFCLKKKNILQCQQQNLYNDQNA